MSDIQDDLFEAAPAKIPGPKDKLPSPELPFLPGIHPDATFLEITGIDQLEAMTRECRRCSLREGCRQTVFADGDRKADIMMIGEGPGQSEDEIGRPFVGKAGQLLDKIFEAADLHRERLYITNVVKCRPPGNRLPNPDEIAACRGILEAQIRMVQPRLIVCLGALATQTVIEPRGKITLMRGRWVTRQGIMIMPTFHPAALLRNQSLKRPVWEDFKLIRAEAESKGLKR